MWNIVASTFTINSLLWIDLFFKFSPYIYIYICNVTPPAPTHFTSSFSILFIFWPAGDQPVAEGGNAHFFTTTWIRSGGQEKIKQTNKHEQCLGLTQEQKESYATLCIPDSIYGLTLAWVTSENSTKQLECRHLDSVFFAGPYLSAGFTAPVSGVLPLSVVPRQLSLLTRLSAVPSPTALVRVPSSTPLSSFFQPTLLRVPLPLPDTARFQVQKSFVWFRAKTDKGIVCSGHPYSATYIYIYIYIYI